VNQFAIRRESLLDCGIPDKNSIVLSAPQTEGYISCGADTATFALVEPKPFVCEPLTSLTSAGPKCCTAVSPQATSPPFRPNRSFSSYKLSFFTPKEYDLGNILFIKCNTAPQTQCNRQWQPSVPLGRSPWCITITVVVCDAVPQMTLSDRCGGVLALERLSRGSIKRMSMRRRGQVVSED
jgi:hypothetical protein